MVSATFALLAVLASPAVAQAGPVAGSMPAHTEPFLSMAHAPETIDRIHVDLVRGEVEVVRRPGAIQIDASMQAGPHRGVAPRIRTTQAGHRLHVFDAYPAPRGVLRECYPAAGERGAFWDSDSAVKIVVSIPEGVEVSAFVMAGNGSR